jgi:hypothetical protein
MDQNGEEGLSGALEEVAKGLGVQTTAAFASHEE